MFIKSFKTLILTVLYIFYGGFHLMDMTLEAVGKEAKKAWRLYVEDFREIWDLPVRIRK